MTRKIAVLCVLLFCVPVAFPQEKPKESVPKDAPAELKIPDEDAKRVNPVKPTEGSIAEGKKLFGYQCAMCHGAKGDGTGDLVEPMKLRLRDWTDAESLKDLSDGSLFYIITKGKGKMPDQQGRMSAQQQWNLINYIRSLAKKREAAKPVESSKP